MDNKRLLNYIYEFVSDYGPIKSTELVTIITRDVFTKKDLEEFKETNIIEAIQDAVNSNLILEVEYTLPNAKYRIKSMYFPQGTTLNTHHPT